MNQLIIAQAAESDLPAILEVQKKAFLEVARFFHLNNLPPLEQTLESVSDELEKGVILKATLTSAADMKDRQNVMALLQRMPSCDLQVIRAGSETNGAISYDPQIAALPPGACNDKIIGRIVGSVRAYQKGDTGYIGKLVVLPEYQNQGIGKALMDEIENQFHNTVARYEIFTGSRDPRNRYVYDQLGYKPFRTERINAELTFVYMEKRV